MEPSLYLETTIPSFLIGGISPVLATAAHQAATRRWWEEERQKYRLFVSTIVEDEILQGDSVWARQRVTLLEDVPRLVVDDAVGGLGRELHAYLRLAPSAETDALHLALACHYELDYLLTWNMKHLANARIRHSMQRYHDETGVAIPTICTPEELGAWGDVP